MSVGAFAADFGFHFGGSRIVEAGNIGFLFGFGFHFGFAFGFLFFPLKDDTAHHSFFYTHKFYCLRVRNVDYRAGRISIQ